MKKFAYMIAIAGILLVASCKRNACDSQYCSNSGTCVNGTCSCQQGWSGTHCQTDTAAYATFWTSTTAFVSPFSIPVQLQNSGGSYSWPITQSYPLAGPTCGNGAGCANFRVAPGTYTYTATYLDTTWTGSVTLATGNCTLQQLNLNTGNVTFWADTAGNTVTVTIASINNYITQAYTTTTPNCGAIGCANFSLPPGTYNYTGSSSSANYSGSVTVVQNQCTLKKLL